MLRETCPVPTRRSIDTVFHLEARLLAHTAPLTIGGLERFLLALKGADS